MLSPVNFAVHCPRCGGRADFHHSIEQVPNYRIMVYGFFVCQDCRSETCYLFDREHPAFFIPVHGPIEIPYQLNDPST